MAKKNKKTKFEFSKCLTLLAVITLFGVSIWSIIRYYNLTKYAIERNSLIIPDSALPIACITTIMGTILSYCLYQGLLKTSLNKNRLTIDDNGTVKPILENIITEIVEEPCCCENKEDDFPPQTLRDCEYKG